MLGLGTWEMDPDTAYTAVLSALEMGYRHIDCAKFYNNQTAVGKALKQAFKLGLVTRDSVWITSKLWCNAHKEEDVLPAIQDTLAELQLEYLDLYLIHWPIPMKTYQPTPNSLDMFYDPKDKPSSTETWLAMDAIQHAGYTRHIGVSNFSQPKIEALIKNTGIMPEVNQIERHPFLQQPELIQFCKTQDIRVTNYSPLARNDSALMQHAIITQLAEKHNCTPAQIILCWGLDGDSAVIPKSINKSHQADNLAVLDIALTDQDRDLISTLDRHHRYVAGAVFEFEGSPYTLKDLWDE